MNSFKNLLLALLTFATGWGIGFASAPTPSPAAPSTQSAQVQRLHAKVKQLRKDRDFWETQAAVYGVSSDRFYNLFLEEEAKCG